MRISIVGLPASGKTVVAHIVSMKLAIPHVHLDRFWFRDGWYKIVENTPPQERERVLSDIKQKIIEATKAESWVSDGFYPDTVGHEIAQRADIILFLDISLSKRLFNHLHRMCMSVKKHAKLQLWYGFFFFFRIVFRARMEGPKLKNFINSYKDKVIVLKSRKEIDQYIRTLVG